MIVEPDFPTHWKTQLLITLVAETAQDLLRKTQAEPNANPSGTQSEPNLIPTETHANPRLNPALIQPEAAPMWILKLWAYCQQRRAFTFPKMSNAMLRAVCDAPIPPDRWKAILLECHWIDDDGTQIIVRGWDAYNAKLVGNWTNGPKGGRPKKEKGKPNNNPKETQGDPNGIREEKRREDVPPSVPQGGPDNFRKPASETAALPGQKKEGAPADPSDCGRLAADAEKKICAIFQRRRGGLHEEGKRHLWSWAEKGLLPLSDEDWRQLTAFYTPLPRRGELDERNRRQSAEKLAEFLSGELDAARSSGAGAGTAAKKTPAALPEPPDWRERWRAKYGEDPAPDITWQSLPPSEQQSLRGGPQ